MITLSDIVVRAVQLDWHEAVALLRDVIDNTPQSVEANSVPELSDVELLHWGQVKIHESAQVPDPVEHLQRMLGMLLGTDVLPSQLAERILQSDGSIEAFSSALAYFERPDRVAILQGVYSRASGSSVPPNADELIASLRAASAAASTEISDYQDAKGPSSKKMVFGGLAIFAVLAVVTGAAIVMGWGRAEPMDAGGPTLVSRVSDGVAGVTAAVGSAVASFSGRAPAAVPTPLMVPAPDAEGVEQPGRGDRIARRSQAFGVSVKPSPDQPTIPPDNPIAVKETLMVQADDRKEGQVISRVLPQEDSTTIYSSSSSDVAAPQFLRPHLPNAPPHGRGGSPIPSIQVVVLRDGTVGSVRLLGEPRTINDSMLLSAAKAWRFIPAMKDGAPVPYRMTISVGR